MAFDIDVRHVAPTVNVPTLIIHAADDQVCHVENARFLARTIPGAQYVELAGGDHVPWFDPDETVAEIREFLTGMREAAALIGAGDGALHRPRRLTALAADLGDRRWRDLSNSITPRYDASSHDSTARDRYGGRRLLRDLRRARASDQVRAVGYRVRATARSRGARRIAHGRGRARRRQDRGDRGQHRRTGRRTGGRRRGARLGHGKDLVAGSGLEFEDRGMAALIGIPGEWRLFAVVG